MNNWFIDYHHALQLRLAGLLIVFGIIYPGLCMLVSAGHKLAKRFARRAGHGSASIEPQHGTMSLGNR